MRSNQIRRLPGIRDVTGSAYKRLKDAQGRFCAFASDRGYEVIDTPVLEETELFVRKSGGALSSQLYSFLDPGGHRVSLRPEFTSSVIRHFIEERDRTTLPVRWQYGGPVFRHDHGGDESYRQFTQVGAELIGIAGIEADLEVMALAWGGLRNTGLQEFQIRLGHLGVLQGLLACYGLSESAKLFIIGGIKDLKSGRTDVAAMTEQAREMGLLTDGPDLATANDLASAGTQATRELVQGVLAGSISSKVGRRTSDEIVDRLLRKVRVADRPDRLRAALEMVAELATLQGPPESTLERAKAIVDARGLSTRLFDELDGLCDALATKAIDQSRTVLDFGLVRGISYYTGVIFELIHTASSNEVSLGGGGRYDGLVGALGGDDVPALGFACTLEHVVQALEHESSQPAAAAPASSNT